MEQYLTIWDFILTPIYLLALSAIAQNMRNKRYPPGHPLRTFYMKGLYLKFFGAIFIALIYQYYYGGGDTYNFFAHSRIINSSLEKSPAIWFKLITHQSPINNPEIYQYTAPMIWYNDTASYAVAVVGAIFGLLNGTSYIPIALLFAFFSYTGIWAMYRTFVNIYPRLYKELALAFLFIPSTFVWGSAVFKDTVCMFGLGWMTHTVFRLFIQKDYSIKNLALLLLSFYLIYRIKLYILLGFIPALSIWLLTMYSHRIKSIGLRIATKTGFIAFSIGAFFFFSSLFADELAAYSLENIAKTSAKNRDWIAFVSERDEGSGYDLGEFDPSIQGMLQKFPQGVVVTLFRPFPWEAKKPIVLLSALEALLFIFLTVRAFYKRGIGKTFKLIGHDPNLLFFLIFSIIFAFAVGISTFNFGTLSRYKIPAVPFFAAAMIVLYYYDKQSQPQPSVNDQRKQKPVHRFA